MWWLCYLVGWLPGERISDFIETNRALFLYHEDARRVRGVGEKQSALVLSLLLSHPSSLSTPVQILCVGVKAGRLERR